MASSEKSKSGVKPLARVFPYLLRYKGHVAGALFFLVMAAVTTLALPLAVRRMIDNGFSASDSLFINTYFAMLVVISAVLAISSAGRYYFVIWLGERVVSDLRKDVFTHVTKLSANFFDTAQTGEIISRLTADTTQIKSAVGATASVALRNILLVLGSISLMIYTSPRLSTIVLVAIPLIVMPIIAFGRAVRQRSRYAQDTLADATAYASESISSVRTLQSFSNEPLVANKFSNAVENAFEAARKSIFARSLLTAFAIFVIFSSVVAVLWFGAQDVLSGTMTAGTLSQFLLYSVIAAGALGALSEVWGELSLAAGAAERLTELLEEVPAVSVPANPVPLPSPSTGAVRFDKVSFAYPARSDVATLKEISFDVKPGETVAIVGSSGAGKSTLFSLLLRFYDVDGGTILMDDIDVRKVAPTDLRNHMALVPQDTNIFATSIMENIRFGRPDASDEDVYKAADTALAREFIEDMADGFETSVGERGVTLSGGQRQRVAIARAVLKNAPVLLLDEATSALDAESETLVQKALDFLMEDRTTIVIAHRLATVLKADRILVLDAGKIVEEGNHKSLVKKDGIYAKLARLQFDTANEAMA